MLTSRILSLFVIIAMLAGCASTPLPALPPTHPASPKAAEAAIPPATGRLSADAATRTTNELLRETSTLPSTPTHGPTHH
jgi:hypothetical protein